MMRRPLVLRDEAARHWFRAKLPPDRTIIVDREPTSDVRMFFMSFFAAFLAFYGFLS